MPLPLNNTEPGISIVLIPHNNPDRFHTRMQRDLLPTLIAHPLWKFQIIIVDNSDEDNKIEFHDPKLPNLSFQYMWPGKNIMYGPAMNLALSIDTYPFIIYLCTNHGRMYDPGWIDDLIRPLMENAQIGMTGSIYPSSHPTSLGFPPHLPSIHIQGGIFGARASVLRAYPYTCDKRWIHWESDIFESYQLLNAGFLLHEVTSIKSVWRQNLDSPEQWKYVHDYSEE